MSRSERLLELLQILHRRRRPVPGAALAEELGISLRTLYRDIRTLQNQGAGIDGEAGLGYVLQPGFTLPPLMFTEDEIEAIGLGANWVAEHADAGLAGAAENVLAKISAVLPEHLRESLYSSPLLIGPSRNPGGGAIDIANLRQAIRNERKLAIVYLDKNKKKTKRTIWPFVIGFFDDARVVVGWCELRQAIRHFRVDRIVSFSFLPECYPVRRTLLLRQFLEAQDISER